MNTDENICGKNSRPCRQENHHHFGGACGHAFPLEPEELPLWSCLCYLHPPKITKVSRTSWRQHWEKRQPASTFEERSHLRIWGCLGLFLLCDSFHIRCERNDVTWPIGVRSNDHCGLHWKEWCIPIDRFWSSYYSLVRLGTQTLQSPVLQMKPVDHRGPGTKEDGVLATCLGHPVPVTQVRSFTDLFSNDTHCSIQALLRMVWVACG